MARGTVLCLADFLWSGLVVAPLVVTYWRGTWDLLADLVYPPSSGDTSVEPYPIQKQLSGLVCYLLGVLVRIALDLIKENVGQFLAIKPKCLRKSLTWLFTTVYALAGVSFWRGVWFLMKMDIGIGTITLLAVLCVSLTVLSIFGVSRSLISSPLAISLDDQDEVFQRTIFFSKAADSTSWFIFDVIFINLVIRQLIVFCWWSLWSLENQFFPQYLIRSEEDILVSYDSLALGYAGAALCLILDKLIQNLTTTKLYIVKLKSTLVTLLAFFSSVNVWRGLWSLLNCYFLPNIDHDENYMIGHVVGLMALSLMMMASTIANDSIVKNSEFEPVVDIRYWNKKNSFIYSLVKEEDKTNLQEQDS